AADFPALPRFRIAVGGSQVNIADTLRKNGQSSKALEWCAKSIQTLEGVLGQVRADATARRFLRNAHWARAEALDDLERYAEPPRDGPRARQCPPKSDPPHPHPSRLFSCVRELEKPPDPDRLYDAACVFAAAAGRREVPQGPWSKEDCARRAVAL